MRCETLTLQVGAHFRVVGESFAGGALPPEIGAGDAVRIFTGASLPNGADRVLMQENCRADGSAMDDRRTLWSGLACPKGRQ